MQTGKDVLHLYIYIDGEVDKSGNNVVSCLMNYFKEMRYLSRPTFGQLTIFSDNCPGKNKNKINIFYIICLVDTTIFYHITLFFIRGYAKNTADRLFNLLKDRNYKREIFIYFFEDTEEKTQFDVTS